MLYRGLFALAAVLAGCALVQACSLCEGNAFTSPTFRQEAALTSARLILHVTVTKARLNADDKGETEFAIKTVVRSDPVMKDRLKLVVPRYLPDREGTPYLLFCDIDRGKVDPYRGVRIQGPATVDYIKKALALNGKDAAGNLEFFFRYLDDPDPEVARDAFLEFAKAKDADIQKAAGKLDASKLRRWLEDPKTPAQRIGVYALLLGACGKSADIAWLRTLLESKEERYANAADGLLAGYMQGKPKEGWELLQAILADGRRPLLMRLAVLRTLRFYHGAQPKESRPEVVKAMKTLLRQGELADLAIEDLRRWEIWDLSPDVLKLYGQKGFDAPLMRRAILRYALSSKPTREVSDFLARRRAAEPEEVKDVEEGLRYEKAAK